MCQCIISSELNHAVAIYTSNDILFPFLPPQIGESEALADRCRDSCKIQKIEFFRFNPNLPEKIDPGVTDNLKLLEMMTTARIYMHTQTSQLDKLLPLLQQ